MKSVLDNVEFYQDDVVNQEDSEFFNGHFFLIYDDEDDFLIGGCFASSYLDALDTLANNGLLDHRNVPRGMIKGLNLGTEYDHLGEDQSAYWIQGINVVYAQICTDVTHILNLECR